VNTGALLHFVVLSRSTSFLIELVQGIFSCLCNPRISVRIYYFLAIIGMISLHLSVHVAALCNKLLNLIEEYFIQITNSTKEPAFCIAFGFAVFNAALP
jgi:hypothetical protein